MTGPEHYREAERVLAAIAPARARWDGDLTDVVDTEAEQVLPFGLWSLNLAYAQVHATLALAAATGTRGVVEPGSGDRSPADDEAWYEAAGVRG